MKARGKSRKHLMRNRTFVDTKMLSAVWLLNKPSDTGAKTTLRESLRNVGKWRFHRLQWQTQSRHYSNIVTIYSVESWSSPSPDHIRCVSDLSASLPLGGFDSGGDVEWRKPRAQWINFLFNVEVPTNPFGRWRPQPNHDRRKKNLSTMIDKGDFAGGVRLDVMSRLPILILKALRWKQHFSDIKSRASWSCRCGRCRKNHTSIDCGSSVFTNK